MSESTRYVGYVLNGPQKTGGKLLYSSQGAPLHEKKIMDLVGEKQGVLLKTFIESGETRHRSRWSALEEAVTFCLEQRANLVIAEIKNLTSNEAFCKHLLRLIGESRHKNDISAQIFTPELHCCDQAFIQRDNFVALVEHARQQRKLHGDLIKEGLSRTSAKSGNPHAAEVISKVNKPKIDNAIVFALLLQPVISHYQKQGYSQRKMVEALNEEGFHAPEGGNWVLSQFQKVLDRVKLNEAALSLEKRLVEYKAKAMSPSYISDELNKLGIPSPKGKEWTQGLVIQVSERIKQIHDIIRFYDFVLEIMPILEKYHIDEMDGDLLEKELANHNIDIPKEAWM